MSNSAYEVRERILAAFFLIIGDEYEEEEENKVDKERYDRLTMCPASRQCDEMRSARMCRMALMRPSRLAALAPAVCENSILELAASNSSLHTSTHTNTHTHKLMID